MGLGAGVGDLPRAALPEDPRFPDWLAASVAFGATLLVAVVLSQLTEATRHGSGLAAMSAVVAVVAWWSRPLMSLASAGLAWLMLNGFVVHHSGQLQWQSSSDSTRVIVLFAVAAVVSASRAIQVRFTYRAPAELLPSDLVGEDDHA